MLRTKLRLLRSLGVEGRQLVATAVDAPLTDDIHHLGLGVFHAKQGRLCPLEAVRRHLGAGWIAALPVEDIHHALGRMRHTEDRDL